MDPTMNSSLCTSSTHCMPGSFCLKLAATCAVGVAQPSGTACPLTSTSGSVSVVSTENSNMCMKLF